MTSTSRALLDAVLPSLVNDLLVADEPVTLVLDDYHVLANPELHRSVVLLLRRQPPGLHLVIATRGDPRCRAGRCGPAASCSRSARPTSRSAIEHSAAGGDVTGAAELVASHWNARFNAGRLATVEGWLDRLPPAVLDADARLCVARAWLLIDQGRLAEVDRWPRRTTPTAGTSRRGVTSPSSARCTASRSATWARATPRPGGCSS